MIGLSILTSASAARKGLTPAARRRMLDFFHSRRHEDGGFVGRDPGGTADLYYGFFGLAAMLALGAGDAPLRETGDWLETCRLDDPKLDPIHRICLAQGLALARRRRILRWVLGRDRPGPLATTVGGGSLARRVLRWTSPFSSAERAVLLATLPVAERQTTREGEVWPELYLLFLRAQLYESMGIDPARAPVLASLDACHCRDGGYGSAPGMSRGVTSATAAALVLQARIGCGPDPAAVDWLLARRDAEGGFAGAPDAPLADLLSSAVALFALDFIGHSLDPLVCEETESYVSAHWNDDGGFCATVLDPDSDVEYSFYGLLALGCLRRIQNRHTRA